MVKFIAKHCVLIIVINAFIDRIIVCSGTVAVAIANGSILSNEYNEKSCPRRCSEDYYPQCGINQNGDTKVFVNDCYMSMENCNQLADKGKFVIFVRRSKIYVRHWRLFFGWFSVYQLTDESDCPDFDEWISEESLGKRRNNWKSVWNVLIKEITIILFSYEYVIYNKMVSINKKTISTNFSCYQLNVDESR